MNREQLFEQIVRKRSFLCVGLDVDPRKTGGEVFDFNRRVIDATAPYVVAFKPNLAFYEAGGAAGVEVFEQTCRYIRTHHPKIMIIADAKRGDIGNTSEMYARAFFEDAPLNDSRGLADDSRGLADAVTLAPYMGRDSIDPFLKYRSRWAVVLALTSNPSADDFETLILQNGDPLWKEVLRRASAWGTPDNMMFVVGATRASLLTEVRAIVPDHFLLVPGVGAQGGSLEDVARHGMNNRCGLIVNSSRAIIYADDPAAEARKTASQMAALLDRHMKI